MKRSEKILLTLFGALFLVIVGGGAATMGVRYYLDMLDENKGLQERIITMRKEISQGEEWHQRHEWIQQHIPSFSSVQEASSRLLETIQREADKASLVLVDKQFIEPLKTLGPDGLPLEEESGYHDQASVKITLTKVKEQPLMAWLHALQTPQSFIGITRLMISPAGEGKTVNVEAELTQFYQEKAPAKISKVGTP